MQKLYNLFEILRKKFENWPFFDVKNGLFSIFHIMRKILGLANH